jgi:hypothetical protein
VQAHLLAQQPVLLGSPWHRLPHPLGRGSGGGGGGGARRAGRG